MDRGLPLGLFRGVRTFTLTPQGGQTHLRVSEEFTGPLLPLVRRNLPDLGQAFTDYVSAVKYRAEIMP